MPKINVLPKHMADLIAAGEMVERPASVVKELMENAIDAGATAITVEIKHGGVTYMRVTDNGCGIAREDIKNAFKSHATSKILTEEDLHKIGTLGFRGEALASIAAVSRVDILTRTPEDDIGTVYKVEGSEEVLLDDAGCPSGTTIVVKDLFYNTPARMKFLKKDVTEGNSVAGVVDRIALSHPEVSIRFIRDDRQQLATPGNGKLNSTVYSVFGSDFSAGLMETEYELGGIKVAGLISKPSASRSNRSMQFFFLNGRLVKSKTATAALEQAYKNAIMVGRFPSCVLNITMPLEAVDVNVHPAKTEVRFENERPVFDAVYYAVKNAIQQKDTPNRVDLSRLEAKQQKQFKAQTGEQLKINAKDTGLPQKVEGFWSKELPKGYREDPGKGKAPAKKPKPVVSAPETPLPKKEEKQPQAAIPYVPKSQRAPAKPTYLESPKPVEKAVVPQPPVVEDIPLPQEAPPERKAPVSIDITPEPEEKEPPVVPYAEQVDVPDFRIVGEAFKTYILVEVENKMLLIDKHAAHERILFDRLRAGTESIKTQLLLAPVAVSLSKEEYSVLMENKATLAQAGYDIDDFGVGTILIREMPVMLVEEDPKALLEELAGYLLSNRALEPEKLEWLYENIACRAAMKAGNKTTLPEQEKLVEYLLSNRDIRYCPHGRPILIEMTRTELEKQFGRIQ